MKRPIICKDCMAEFGHEVSGGWVYPSHLKPRPIVEGSGGRCATHARKRKREVKGTAHERYVQRTYNMAPGEYDRLYRFQGGACAICRRANGSTKKLAVDHDHKCCPSTPTCGKCTRMLACGPCNRLLGHFRDSPDLLRGAADALERPPYRIMKEVGGG